jgi:hypothetical protein
MQAYAQLENQAYEREYQKERDRIRDEQWERGYGLDVADLLQDAGQRGAADVDKQVAAISKGMEDLTPLQSAFNEVQAMISGSGDDISGVGRFVGGSGALGRTLRLASSLGGSDAQRNYSTVEGLLSAIRRNAIGSQQTRQELAKIEQRLGTSGWEDESVFRQAVGEIGKALQEERRNVLARGDTPAQQVWAQRSGQTLPGAAPAQSGGNRIVNFEDLK